MDIEKEKQAIETLKAFEPKTEPYYLCYSGGKDSDCIRILAQLAGVSHEIHHNHTTVDAPETVRYVRSIPNVIIHYPKLTMWQLIVKNGIPPTRIARYCCSELKEGGGKGRVGVTGVRKAESVKRAKNGGLVKIIGKPVATEKAAQEFDAEYEKTELGGVILNTDNAQSRRLVEHCYRTTKTLVNPIIDWSDEDVWAFLHHYGCDSNPLYREGCKRIGCIGCPLSGSKHMREDFIRYPKYKEAYIRAFDKMLVARKERGLPEKTQCDWSTGENVMRWWLGEDTAQIRLDDLYDDSWYIRE